MDDAVLVRAADAFGNLPDDGQRVLVRQRSLGDAVGKGGAFPSSSTSDRIGGCPGSAGDSSRPWIWAMFGWFSAASTRASRVKRASRSGSAATVAGSRLSATSRFSRVSRARNTSPMPPAPSGPRMSNAPTRVTEGFYVDSSSVRA